MTAPGTPAGRLVLRPVTADDRELLRSWRNDPSVRRQSFNSAEVTEREHIEWLNARLADDRRCRLYVAELDGEPAGQARVELSRDGAGEISVSLDAKSQGRGVGTALIVAASQRGADELGLEEIVARIKPTNARSLRAFAKAGYADAEETTEEVVLRWRSSAHRAAEDRS